MVDAIVGEAIAAAGHAIVEENEFFKDKKKGVYYCEYCSTSPNVNTYWNIHLDCLLLAFRFGSKSITKVRNYSSQSALGIFDSM